MRLVASARISAVWLFCPFLHASQAYPPLHPPPGQGRIEAMEINGPLHELLASCSAAEAPRPAASSRIPLLMLFLAFTLIPVSSAIRFGHRSLQR